MKVIQTERLCLRHLCAHDAAFILELLNEPSFIENIADRGVRTEEDARLYIADGPAASYERFGFGLFLTELKETGVPIGICGLLKREYLDDVDIGYAFLPRFWSKGYAFESASAVLSHARDVLGLKRVVATTTPTNGSSIQVLEKLGFRFEKWVDLPGTTQESKLFAFEL